MPRGVSLKCARTISLIFSSRQRARVERVDQHRHRLGHADRVRELHHAALGEPGRDDVLGDVARHVAGRAVDLRRILARERAAAVRRRAAVGVDDDLAAGDAGVAVRAADDESAGRVDEDARLACRIISAGITRLTIFSVMSSRSVSLVHVGAVLGRDDDRVDADRLVAVVFDADLRLAVGPQVVETAVAARARQALARACAPA